MRVKNWATAAGLALLMPSTGGAVTEATFDLRSAGDLAALCSATADNGMGTAALNFCEGYFQGAVTVEMLNMATFRGPKLFCLPNPPPTRAETMSDFASWARAAPGRTGQSPTDGLFGFLRERYPCPPSR
jgi:hypothetical protein